MLKPRRFIAISAFITHPTSVTHGKPSKNVVVQTKRLNQGLRFLSEWNSSTKPVLIDSIDENWNENVPLVKIPFFFSNCKKISHAEYCSTLFELKSWYTWWGNSWTFQGYWKTLGMENFTNCGHQATGTIVSISSRLNIGGSRGRRSPTDHYFLNSKGFSKGY